MANPITGLTASWLDTPTNAGIQLSWTAASDVTNGSSYEIYVLQDVDQIIPNWILATTLSPNAVRSIGATTYSLVAPSTSYFYTIPSNMENVVSYAFNIIHIDDTGASSQPVTISAFKPAKNPIYGFPHLTNQVAIDSYGQFVVSPQDSYEEISNCVAVVVGTDLGGRPTVPSFGIEDLPMTQINPVAVENAINKWEPRARAKVTLSYDNNNNATLNVNIDNNQGGA